jgi:hypothetical protein
MGSPSSGSTPMTAAPDRREEAGDVLRTPAGPEPAVAREVVFVACFGSAIAADFVAFMGRETRAEVVPMDDESGRARAGENRVAGEPASLVVFLPQRLGEPERSRLEWLLDSARGRTINFVGIVGTFRVHLNDPVAEETERSALALVRSSGIQARVTVFRSGLVLSPNSCVSRWLGRLGPLFPLAPGSLRTCFIEGEELFAAIEAERSGAVGPVGAGEAGPAGRPVGRGRRAYTFLGANLAWRELLVRHRGISAGSRLATAVARLLSWLLAGQLVALAVRLQSKWFPWASTWSVQTLEPRSMREIVSLTHQGNIGRVRVVGYNNGVNHFGHRYPGRTVVSTIRCRRVVHAGPGVLKADCGATIRSARDYLGGRSEELFVLPNYSYVSVGTSFIVPIHGSSVDYATVADTACRVVLYDPDTDRIISAERDAGAFRENVYNSRSRAVVLRLYLRTKPKSRYYVRRETWMDAGADKLLAALRDGNAANVEIRQAHAASGKVTVSKYYTKPSGPSGSAQESPRDALGRLWDRLEENPVTSFLMHALSRHVAWHTELFLTPAEFERFWATHAEVPLRKIQLRYIRRDGMPHSPFRDNDCVSADLFLFRFDKAAFDGYLARNLPSVRCNPGKHSN